MRKRIFSLSILLSVMFLFLTNSALAMSQKQKELFNSGIMYFDYETSDEVCGATAINNIGSGGEFTSDEMKTFMHSPINSTFGVSDTIAEQWFLKQAGANRVKNKYGITSGNIGEITSAIKAAGVSVVFFYSYTVSEGGGAGGFINHYGSDGPGGGVGNATRDAQYLIETSNKTGLNPSWIDAGNPVDFVPQEIKDAGNADFQSMSQGSIGRVYLPATAAAAWEVYYPDGLKKEFNKVQNYGHPLSDAMSNIKKMGGDPLQGGLVPSINCQDNISLTGEGMEKAVNWARTIATNDGYGYDQPTRASGWQKWQTDPNCVGQCGSFDCSSFISSALTVAGYYKENPLFNTGNEATSLQSIGFTKIADSGPSSENLKPGDILIKDGHTAMYIGNNQIVHASINENGGTSGGQVGDQTGKEITIRSYSSNGWNGGVWRAPN